MTGAGAGGQPYKVSWIRGRAAQSYPRVGWTRGSGRVRSGRVTILPDFGGSGQHLGFISFFTDYFLVSHRIWIEMNLRILHSDWLIFIDI